MPDKNQNKTPIPQSTPPKSPINTAVWVVGAAALWLVIVALNMQTTPKASQPYQAAPGTITSDLKAQMALVINLSGQLCANVTEISRISGDLYRATCTRYRDGTGTATYEVDAATGKVK